MKNPGILFLNFGGPTGEAELVPFLTSLLGDVLPGPLKGLAGFIAKRRARIVGPRYEGIGWSTLIADSKAQAEATVAAMGPQPLPWALGMMFSPPSVADGLRTLASAGCDGVIALGLFPHWSFATTGSAIDMLHDAQREAGTRLPVHHVRAFFDHPRYVRAVANTIEDALAALPGEGPAHLLFSAHGIPVSFVRKGDPYPDHVKATVRATLADLSSRGWNGPSHLSWQSRVGPIRWLGPSTPQAVEHLAKQGVKRLVVVPVSFVSEHIETLDELDRELIPEAIEAGIPHVGRARALGTHPDFIATLAELANEALTRFDVRLCARCLLPEPPERRAVGTCKDCGFVRPRALRGSAA